MAKSLKNMCVCMHVCVFVHAYGFFNVCGPSILKNIHPYVYIILFDYKYIDF